MMGVFDKEFIEDMTEDEVFLLVRWGNPQPIKDVDSAAARFEMAGTMRNIERWAQNLGPHLIAQMMEASVLRPEQDPREALTDLIERAGRESSV